MILTLFLQGAVPQIHAFFHHRFLDLSLISRFPISGVFCGVLDFTLFKKEIEIDKSHKG
jgi:oligoribonuclease (3'-5' exoribonuclease)